MFYVDNQGRLFITAEGTGLDLSSNNAVVNLISLVDKNDSDIQNEISRAIKEEEGLRNRIELEEERAMVAESYLNKSANSLDERLTSEVNRAVAAENALSERIAALQAKVDAL